MARRFIYPLVGLVFVAAAVAVIFWSRSDQTRLAIEQGAEKISTKPSEGSVLNASYSAVPTLTETVSRQKTVGGSSLITNNGNDLLVLVNKSIGLAQNFVPDNLISINGLVPTTKTEYLREPAAAALVKMFATAKEAGFNLSVTSAYRSYASQVATFNSWVALSGLAAASQFSARPGHSQHQLGTALDLSATEIKDNLTVDFGKTAEGLWLAANAYKYGYVLSYPAGKEAITGYSYEPWHYRYIGVASATQLHNLGWDLETYLQKYGVW